MTEHAKSLNEMNSEELKKETEKMAAYIELLNKQYSQMLNAMNVKTGKQDEETWLNIHCRQGKR